MILGGDQAAEAKAEACLRAGGEVTVIAPEVTPGLQDRQDAGRVRRVTREYHEGDLAGALVAYGSLRDPELVARVRAEAERERVLLSVIDVPEVGTFLSGAVVARGDLQVAIGTGGASPGLCARLRRELEIRLGPEYEPFVAILSAVRCALDGNPERGTTMSALLDSPLLDLVRRRERGEVDRLLRQMAGEGCSLARLGLEASV